MTYNPKSKILKLGKIAKVKQIEPYEAKRIALLMIRRGQYRPGTLLDKVIKLLSTGGVFPEKQIMELTEVSRRSLQNYRQKGYIDLLPAPIKLASLIEKPRIYTLGPIGLALAKLQDKLIPTGYLNITHDRITHDVLCNLVYYKIYLASRKYNLTAILHSRYEATIQNRKGQPILEPDAMITLQSEDGTEIKILVEYHNENYSSRAGEKIRKYEHVYREGYWRSQWHVDRFPPILIATTHMAPVTGYDEQIKLHMRGAGLKCTYLMKSLKKLLDDSDSPLDWFDLEKKRNANLLQM